jgi:hypothetical protein
MTADQEKGYIFQVDLEYPKELHEKHNDYPLAVESLCVDETELSPYQNALKDKVPSSIGKVKKLIGTLKDKINYVIHYRNLQLYLSLGLKLKKITKLLSLRTIRSEKHQLSTIEINKIGLCAFDDKRYILDDGSTTLAYGNKAIEALKAKICPPISLHL